jgi:hypothetical protein
VSPTSFNELDPAEDAAFPRIFPFDPEASPASEPPRVGDEVPPAPMPLPPDVPDDADDDVEVDPADLVVDESQLDDEELLEADAPEPEEITDIEIGVD